MTRTVIKVVAIAGAMGLAYYIYCKLRTSRPGGKVDTGVRVTREPDTTNKQPPTGVTRGS